MKSTFREKERGKAKLTGDTHENITKYNLPIFTIFPKTFSGL